MKKLGLISVLAIATLFALCVSASGNALPYPMIPLNEASEGYTAITNAKELSAISTSGKYILLEDIDLDGSTLIPIGTDESPFEGVFNGNGHTISGAVIPEGYVYAAIFGRIKNAEIRNLAVEDLTVQYTSDSSDRQLPDKVYSAGIAAYAENSAVENCSVSGTVYAKASTFAYAGGVVAYADNVKMKNLQNSASVIAKSSKFAYSSGICACLFDSCSIENAENIGSIAGYAEGVYIGGISAYAKNSTIKASIINVKNSADISIATDKGNISYTVAGILAAGPCNAQKVFNSGNLNIRSPLGATVGGILGNSSHSSVSQAINSGNISASADVDANAGGINAISIYSDIADALNTGSVNAIGSSSGYAGGITSQSRSCTVYRNVINLGNISGTGNIGAISGKSCDFAERFRDEFSGVYAKYSDIPAIGSGNFSELCKLISENEISDPSKFPEFDFESTWIMSDNGIPTPAIAEKISQPDPIRGDADGDGTASPDDLMRMCRSIAGWKNSTVIEANCDYNGDGVFDTADILQFMRMISNQQA